MGSRTERSKQEGAKGHTCADEAEWQWRNMPLRHKPAKRLAPAPTCSVHTLLATDATQLKPRWMQKSLTLRQRCRRGCQLPSAAWHARALSRHAMPLHLF